MKLGTLKRFLSCPQGFGKVGKSTLLKGELRYIPTSRSLGRRLSSKFKTAKGANGARKMLGIRVRVSADSDLFEDESGKQ